VQCAWQEEQVDRHHGGERELKNAGRETHSPQRGVAADEVETFVDLPPHSGGPSGVLRYRLASADSSDRQEGECEEERARHDGDRRGKQRHQRATERRAADLRRRSAALKCAVALRQLIAFHQSHEGSLVGHVEAHRENADEESDNEQHRNAQHAEEIGDGYCRQRNGPAEVRQHHHVARPPPVYPHADEEREQQDRRLLYRTQGAELVGAGIECDHGDKRQGYLTGLCPELRGGLT
jgi:hypothetical protein